jgi:hypothetical protein
MMFKESEIKAIGRQVTTISECGGIGLGYVLPDDLFKTGKAIDGIAWQSGGNGFYYPHKFKQVINDNGQGYLDAIRRMFVGGRR